jgi:hypothetical protein
MLPIQFEPCSKLLFPNPSPETSATPCTPSNMEEGIVCLLDPIPTSNMILNVHYPQGEIGCVVSRSRQKDDEDMPSHRRQTTRNVSNITINVMVQGEKVLWGQIRILVDVSGGGCSHVMRRVANLHALRIHTKTRHSHHRPACLHGFHCFIPRRIHHASSMNHIRHLVYKNGVTSRLLRSSELTSCPSQF